MLFKFDPLTQLPRRQDQTDAETPAGARSVVCQGG